MDGKMKSGGSLKRGAAAISALMFFAMPPAPCESGPASAELTVEVEEVHLLVVEDPETLVLIQENIGDPAYARAESELVVRHNTNSGVKNLSLTVGHAQGYGEKNEATDIDIVIYVPFGMFDPFAHPIVSGGTPAAGVTELCNIPEQGPVVKTFGLTADGTLAGTRAGTYVWVVTVTGTDG